MVFLPDKAPKDPDDFFDWFDEQTEWDEDHDYRDAKVCAGPLKAWFADMIVSFPVLGLKRNTDQDTDYSLGRVMILAVFSPRVAKTAHDQVMALARTHRLGVFEASSDNGTIWWPDGSGGMKQR